MELREKRILITGGSGFLWSHVVTALEGRGCRELFLRNDPQPAPTNGCRTSRA